MAPFALSNEQHDAVYAPGSVLVRAGAGTGKTEVLAWRFVATVAGDVPGMEPTAPERIAAISYTEKSAQEMKERIVQVLASRRQDEGAAELQGHLARAIRAMPLARISTIHAFCARILREHALEAGLDPDFQILDEYETRVFLESKCEELLVRAVRSGEVAALDLVAERGLRGTLFREGALEIITGLVGELARLGRDPSWLITAARTTCTEIASRSGEVASLAAGLIRQIEGMLAIRGIAGAAGERLSRLRTAWPDYRRMLETLSAESDPSVLTSLRDLRAAIPEARAGAVKEAVQAIRAILEKSVSHIGLIGPLVAAYGEQRSAATIGRAAKLLAQIASEIESHKRRERVVTFDDLLAHTERLFYERRDVLAIYRRDLAAIMIDEYQDVDPIQDRIVRMLTEAGVEPAPAYFIVGDEKQSIYRFRGADVSVFNLSRDPAPLEHGLQDNRRSSATILDFVNALSARTMGAESNPPRSFQIQWSSAHHLRPARRHTFGETPVEFLLFGGSAHDANAATLRSMEAEAIAHRIAQLVASGAHVSDRGGLDPRAASFRDVAILLRSFTDVKIYEQALTEFGIPYHTVKGRGFFACQEILDLTALLTVITRPSDAIALGAVLRSPLFGLSDQCLLEIALNRHRGGPSLIQLFSAAEPDLDWLDSGREEVTGAWRILSELREKREAMPLADLIEQTLEMTGYEAVMLALENGRQRAANLRKLVEMARNFEARRFMGCAEFVAMLRHLTDDPPREPQASLLGEDEDVVRLMTIHQAKGLEFQIVVLADIGRRDKSELQPWILSKQYGLLAPATVGSGYDALPSRLIDQHRADVLEEERAESARLLYVALTRARDHLILSEAKSDSRPDSWSAHVRNFIGSDAIENFLNSGQPEEMVQPEGVPVMLRRAEAVPSGKPVGSSGQPTIDEKVVVRTAAARLGFRPPPPAELTLTPSELADFDCCPRQYWLRRELHVPEADWLSIGTASIRDLGTAAHTVLQQLHSLNEQPPSDADIARLAEQTTAGFPDAAQCARTLINDITRYAAQCPAWREDSDERIIGCEVPFFLRIDQPAQPDLVLHGRIDMLATDRNGVVVRDFKYASLKPGAAHPYRLQMMCYALAAAEANPGSVVRAEIVFVRGGTQSVEVELPAKDESRTQLLELTRRIADARAVRQFAKKPSTASECRSLGCGYVSRCWPTGA